MVYKSNITRHHMTWSNQPKKFFSHALLFKKLYVQRIQVIASLNIICLQKSTICFWARRAGKKVHGKNTYYQKDIIFKECAQGHEPRQCVLCVPAFSRSIGGVWWRVARVQPIGILRLLKILGLHEIPRPFQQVAGQHFINELKDPNPR